MFLMLLNSYPKRKTWELLTTVLRRSRSRKMSPVKNKPVIFKHVVDMRLITSGCGLGESTNRK